MAHMLAVFRSYRFIPRVLALLLLGAGVLPFAAHACASMSGEAPMHHTCCCVDEPASHEGAHGNHQPAQMSHHHSSADKMHPVPAAEAQPCEHQDDIPASEACCSWAVASSVADAYVLYSRDTPQLFPVFDARTSLVQTVAVHAFLSPKPPDPPFPGAPALHVLFASFLI